jgi:hypothetical protein
MARKQTKIEIAAAHAREAARALNAAQEAVEAARKVYIRANSEWVRLNAKRDQQRNTEYRVTFLIPSGDGGWDTDCDHYDTLREARPVAQARAAQRGCATIIERVNRLADTETVVATYGDPAALADYGIEATT